MVLRHAFTSMGCPCAIQIEAAAPDIARVAIDRAVAEVDRLDRKYSHYRDDSLLAQWCASAGTARVHRVDDQNRGVLGARLTDAAARREREARVARHDDLALEAAHRCHLRQRHKAAKGNRAEAVFDAVDGLLPERLAEPDVEFVDLQPAPPRGEEVAPLMNDDHEIEDEDDQQEGSDEVEAFHEAQKRAESYHPGFPGANRHMIF